jgi:hypothetical protein
LNDKDRFINFIKEQAMYQALLNKYTELYGEYLNTMNDTELNDSKRKKKMEELKVSMENLMTEIGDTVVNSNIEQNYTAVIQKMREATSTETQKIEAELTQSQSVITAKYDRLIDALNKRNEKLTPTFPEFNKNVEDIKNYEKSKNEELETLQKLHENKIAKIKKDASYEQSNITYKAEELRIRILQDGYEKEFATLELAKQKELAGVKKGSQDEKNIIEYYRQQTEKLHEDSDKKILNYRQINIDNQLSYVKKGSEEEYDLKIQSLELQRQAEITEAEKTGADVLAIDKKYEQLKREALQDRLGEQIRIELKAMEDRLTAMQQIQATEEKAVLERYKSGEINEKEYNKLIAEIKYKYSKEATEAELANLEKLLKAEGLSDEQIAELRKQLTEKNMELSDTETEHTLANIEKENAKRKYSAELAKKYAQQAFELTMDLLSQQSEAKVEELEAELERIDEWKEAELARLDESVMSDETRAAEEKRINEQAKAEQDKLNEQIRAEKVKQFRYDQLQSVAQVAMATAMSIMQTGAKLGYPAAIPFVAIAAAMGAVQTAMILAQKPPKYAKGIYGDDYHEGGYAIVGDAGKKEYGLLPSGKVFETPAFPTLVDLPKFTQIYPDFLTFTRTVNPIPHYEKNTNKTADFDDLKNSIVTAINKNKAVQHVSMNLDANGLWYIANGKGTTSKHINKRVNKR